MDIILVHGAPGAGKSTVAQALHQHLNSPWFEFGWIPEFRQKGEVGISYEEEEQLSFENLCLVARNYLKHGFRNIIITDLRDPIVSQALRRFARREIILITLFLRDEQALKRRVLDETRSSGYRDWQAALELNRLYQERSLARCEVRVDVTEKNVDQVVSEILTLIG